MMHSCIVLQPVGHSSILKYHGCQLTRQSSCASNFYRTLKAHIIMATVLHVTSGAGCMKFQAA